MVQFSKSFTVFGLCLYFQEGHHGPDWRPWQAGSGLRAVVWRPLRYSNITSRNLNQRNGYSWLKLYKVLHLNIYRCRHKSKFSFLYSVMNLHTQSVAWQRGGLGLNPHWLFGNFFMYIVTNNE